MPRIWGVIIASSIPAGLAAEALSGGTRLSAIAFLAPVVGISLSMMLVTYLLSRRAEWKAILNSSSLELKLAGWRTGEFFWEDLESIEVVRSGLSVPIAQAWLMDWKSERQLVALRSRRMLRQRFFPPMTTSRGLGMPLFNKRTFLPVSDPEAFVAAARPNLAGSDSS